MKKFKENYINDLNFALNNVNHDLLEKIANHLIIAKENGNSIYLIGNGGSSANPSHSAGDWAKELGLRAFCLTDNTPIVTAFANDTNYGNIFKGQLEIYLKNSDIVIAYSGSGNSENVINGVKFAKSNKNLTIGITGNYNDNRGGELAKIVDICILIETKSMEIIEDGQLIINHIIKEFIKNKYV